MARLSSPSFIRTSRLTFYMASIAFFANLVKVSRAFAPVPPSRRGVLLGKHSQRRGHSYYSSSSSCSSFAFSSSDGFGKYSTAPAPWCSTRRQQQQQRRGLAQLSSTASSWETNEDLDAEQVDDDDDDEPNEEGDNLDDNDDDESSVFLQQHTAWSQAVAQAIKGLERKLNSLQSELDKAQGIEKTVARGQLIVSNLYLFTSESKLKQATVQDWENDGKEIELILDPKYDSASAEADALFAQARKLKRGSQVIGTLLEETEGAMQVLQDAQLDLAACLVVGVDTTTANAGDDEYDEGMLTLIQNRLQRSSKTTQFKAPQEGGSPAKTKNRKQSPNNTPKKKMTKQQSNKHILDTCVRKLTSPAGCVVWVGRNRRGNEYLSFQVARDSDVWMHARGTPGAHVVLQNRRGSQVEPTDDCWQFCADLAIFYSDFRTERKAEVSAAAPKHVLKPRGAPLGAVKLREELQILTGFPGNVPEELKLARDESGLTDEFRRKDKAKHRKRTKEVAKQVQSKRRAAQKAKSTRKTRKQESESAAQPFDPY